MRSSLLLAFFPAVVLGAPASKTAPLHIAEEPGAAIPGKYIVKFKDGSALASNQNIDSVFTAAGGTALDHVYRHVLTGFSGSFTDQALEHFRGHPDIEFVEQDAVVSIDGFVTQSNAVWGLTRISHRKPGSKDGYTYDSSGGKGTCVYVLDTGIDASHPDFGGRATQLKSFIAGQNTDGNGHGTHCAGTIGSTTYGVAKNTRILGLKVLDNAGRGSISTILAGMDYVGAESTSASPACTGTKIASMSLGSGYSPAVNNAVKRLVNDRHVFVAVAAGNDNKDAARTSPASASEACTVGASTTSDARSYFSNYGSVLDVFAPGSDIRSLAPGGGTAVLSGTSMATPHVAGLAAYLAALGKGTGGALCTAIKNMATRDALSDLPAGTVNLLAFNGNPSG